LRKGNLAAVISGNTIALAIAADLGPEKQFGERSAAFHWRRGHETIRKHPTNPLCAKDEPLNAEVIFVIVSGSNDRWLPVYTIAERGALSETSDCNPLADDVSEVHTQCF
jgi:hypothetical protein